MSELEVNDFAAFFREVHGVDPFPWQQRLAAMVCGEGWPSALDVPTGAGKTAALDVAVFHLAREAARGAQRRAPIRILFVVDRRLVVDDAFERAEAIADALASRCGPVTSKMADALARLAETPERPLVCARLRGGVPKEPDWARTPSQPTIVVSTVDQVGSRLLFRGYGVSNAMKPVHAGLLGADSLLLLDEAHLSQPFVETVAAVVEVQRGAGVSLALGPKVVTLSATQTDEAPALVRDDDRAHSELGRRLRASKPVALISTKAAPAAEAFDELFAQTAWDLSVRGGGSANVVGVVVNRVARARAIYKLLVTRLEKEGVDPNGAVALLVGRVRELDRERILQGLLPRMRARGRQQGDPLFVVATQCIEAGADLDFDALVTEIAPLDSLRQRFGRLNRMGRDIAASGAIIASAEQVGSRAKPDPIYGDAPKATWALLTAHAGAKGKKAKGKADVIDFGVEAVAEWLPEGDALRACLAPREHAPVVLPVFADRWACTSPIPHDDPEVALFLHGPRSGPADVEIVWRADVDLDREDECKRRVAVCPPASGEALSVPFAEALRWLRGEAHADVPDVEAWSEEPEAAEGRGRGRKLVRWRGADDEETAVVTVRDVRPGDLIVVPASYGGCDAWGWNPRSSEAVADLGEEANRKQRERDILRLSGAMLRAAVDPAIEAAVEDWQARRFDDLLASLADASDEAVCESIRTWTPLPLRWRTWLDGDAVVVRDAEGLPLALERPRAAKAIAIAPTEDDEGSVTQRAVPLTNHSAGVRAFAESFAERCGLAPAVAHDVGLAAFLHDAGKAEPSFKLWLYNGDELACAVGEPLAKSNRLRLGPAARRKAGLPTGARHEIASLHVARAHPALREAHDPELVLWLVGTHHGWGRPFFPAVDWPPPGSTFEVDLGAGTVRSRPATSTAELTAWWIKLRERLTARYGPWGLARLEAVVRLADHRRSEVEQAGAEP